MTPKEYLKQAYRLNNRINSKLQELNELKSLSSGVSSPSFGERVQTTRNFEAPFAKQLEKVWELEVEVNQQIDKYIDFKSEMNRVIDEVDDRDEHIVLRCRYVNGMAWEQIAVDLCASVRTVYLWHASALKKVIVPENHVKI